MTSTHFLALAAFAAASSSWAQESVSVRVLFGIADAQPGRWDGSMTVQGATLKSIEAWRPDQGDAITGASWKMSTHPPRLRQAAQQNPQGALPVANGVFIHLDRASENATLAITTAKGDFELKLSEIPYAEAARIYQTDTKHDFPLSEAEFRETIDAEHMVYGMKGCGGPQIAEVDRMLADEQGKANSDLAWLKANKDHLAAAEMSLNEAVATLAAGASLGINH